MFNLVSKNGIATIILVIDGILRFFGIDVDQTVLTTAIHGLATFIAFVFLVWNQLSRKDLVAGIFRKK